MYLFVYVHYLFHYLVVATFILVLKILPCLNKDFVSYRTAIPSSKGETVKQTVYCFTYVDPRPLMGNLKYNHASEKYY